MLRRGFQEPADDERSLAPMASADSARWVLAASTRRAHLDLGNRASQSLRVHADHIIVTACNAHLDARALTVTENYQPKCSNCQRCSGVAGNSIIGSSAGSEPDAKAG